MRPARAITRKPPRTLSLRVVKACLKTAVVRVISRRRRVKTVDDVAVERSELAAAQHRRDAVNADARGQVRDDVTVTGVAQMEDV